MCSWGQGHDSRSTLLSEALGKNMHGLSFDIEEHFQVAAFDCPARRRHWDVFQSRVEKNTHEILDLLETHNVKATMFISRVGC